MHVGRRLGPSLPDVIVDVGVGGLRVESDTHPFVHHRIIQTFRDTHVMGFNSHLQIPGDAKGLRQSLAG